MIRFGETTASDNQTENAVQMVSPAAAVGFAFAAVLTVLMLLMQAQVSRLGFEISSLETELTQLRSVNDKLVISHGELFRVDRVERYALEELGMVKPNPDQIYFLDIYFDDSISYGEN